MPPPISSLLPPQDESTGGVIISTATEAAQIEEYPRDAESEQRALEIILYSIAYAKVGCHLLRETSFFTRAHQHLFRAAYSIASDDKQSVLGPELVALAVKQDKSIPQLELEEVLIHSQTIRQAQDGLIDERLDGQLQQYCLHLIGLEVKRLVLTMTQAAQEAAQQAGSEVLSIVRDLGTALDDANERLRQARQAGMRTADIDTQDLAKVHQGIMWLHKPVLALGQLTFLFGAPFVGKSITAYRYALAEIGEYPWPGTDVKTEEPGPVCWIEGEGQQVSITERIKEWGLSRRGIYLYGEEGDKDLRLPDDLDELRAWLEYRKPRLVVGDSFRTIFTGNENDSKEVTNCLRDFAAMLRELNIAGLMTHHTRKQRELESHVFEIQQARGSNAIYAVARIALAIDLPDRNRETRRLFVAKSNISKPGDAWGIDLDEESGALKFTEDVPLEPAEQMITRTCKDFLTDLLSHGPQKAKDCEQEGAKRGFKQSTVYAAAAKLPVYKRKISGPKGPIYSLWSLTPFPEQQALVEE